MVGIGELNRERWILVIEQALRNVPEPDVRMQERFTEQYVAFMEYAVNSSVNSKQAVDVVKNMLAEDLICHDFVWFISGYRSREDA